MSDIATLVKSPQLWEVTGPVIILLNGHVVIVSNIYVYTQT